MTVPCKVIPLRTAMTDAYEVLKADPEREFVDPREEAHLLNRTLCVLKELEEEWESDHSSIGIRDKIHLLAYYLGRLPQP